eukprot:EG_transcript_33957
MEGPPPLRSGAAGGEEGPQQPHHTVVVGHVQAVHRPQHPCHHVGPLRQPLHLPDDLDPAVEGVRHQGNHGHVHRTRLPLVRDTQQVLCHVVLLHRPDNANGGRHCG